MSFIPSIRPSKLLPILFRMGFKIVRQKGSHAHLEHAIDKTRKITIPIHSRDLPKKTLLSILKQASISIEEFVKLLNRG